MVDEQLEFRLSQYLDGTLPTEAAAALFDELARNPEAVATLDEYRKLDVLMTAKPAAVRWDALAEQISAHIDEAQQSRMRIGIFTRPLRVAMAAAVLLAIGFGSWMMHEPEIITAGRDHKPEAFAKIQGPAAEVAAGLAVADIQIGGPELSQGANADDYFAEFTRPQRVIIATGVNDRQDERPY
jgi:anti-sigma factor RsiW